MADQDSELCQQGKKPRIVSMEDIPLSENGSREGGENIAKDSVPKEKKKRKELAQVDKANWCSFITFSWITKLMILAYRKGIRMNDMPSCSPLDSCESNTQRLEDLWLLELRTRGPKDASFHRAVLKFVWVRVLLSVTCFLLCVICGFLSPTIFMRNLLEFVEKGDGPIEDGIMWALGLILFDTIRIVLATATWAISNRTGIRLQAACLGLLYKKTINMNHLSEGAVGELISLFANDGQRLVNAVTLGPLIIGGPVTAIYGCIYILFILSPAAGWGLAIFLLYYPMQYFLSRAMGRIRQKVSVLTDQRVQLLHETLSSIKVIKMYAWENCFKKKIMGLRNQERKWLERTALIQSLSLSLVPAIPIVAAAVTFLAHIAAGYNLTVSQAFVVIIFYYIMGFSIRAVHFGGRDGFEGSRAVRRLQKFLLLPELRQRIEHPIDRSQAVCLNEASFAWQVIPPLGLQKNTKKERKSDPAKEKLQNNTDQPSYVAVLTDLNFTVTKGQLIGICGVVGGGKTALLKAILGQLRMTSGRIAVDGSCAYVSQTPWILNLSLRYNILFGETFDATRYYSSVYACALNQDVATLPFGDKTELGEQGTNLSGGQRQRVALARAVYANRDIYLLDDPLSAVDMHVGQHIFEKCILGALREKTVILVTHNMQVLSKCSKVCFIQDGHILAYGNHEILMKESAEYVALIEISEKANQSKDQDDGDRPQLLRQLSHTSGDQIRPHSNHLSLISINSANPPFSSQQDLSEEDVETPRMKEQIASGSISWATYEAYVKAAGGFIVAALVLLIFFCNVGSSAFSNWWLSLWLKDGGGNETVHINNGTVTVHNGNIGDNPNLPFYQMIYGLAISAILMTSFCRSIICMKVFLKASSSLHKQLLNKLLHCSMRFFDLTPIGCMLSLFSHDVDEIDVRLPLGLEQVMNHIWVVFFTLLFISAVFPWFLLPLVILTLIFVIVRNVFRVAVRDLKRLEITSRSPLFSHISASVQGVNTIKAFRKERMFLSRFVSLFDAYTVPYYLQRSSFRWLGLRLDVIAILVTASTTALVLGLRGSIPVAFMGLALSYSQQLTGVFQYFIRLCAESEASFTAVERINSYIQETDNEVAPAAVQTSPPSGWPRFGHVSFQGVSLSYDLDLPLVLKGVSLEVEGGEKVGIVGRTGAGKSSLAAALMRLAEITSGAILVDGVNVARVGLAELRTKIGMVPQEPVLFAGSVRWNLDPENKHGDAAIWNALQEVGLRAKVKAMEGGLEAVVQPKGENFSAGEKQLFCMARALLRRCKILFLDEPTASVDSETDALMQEAIQKAFKDCTVLTIAHRVTSILGCHRVLVMEGGKVVEFDRPSVLQANPQSHFSRLLTVAQAETKGSRRNSVQE